MSNNTVKNIPAKTTAGELKAQFENKTLEVRDSFGNAVADDAMVGTGYILAIMDENEAAAELGIVVKGDMTGEGVVNIDDALALFQYSMLPDTYPTIYPLDDLDFTKDGEVNIDDALLLFQYSMLPDVYPID